MAPKYYDSHIMHSTFAHNPLSRICHRAQPKHKGKYRAEHKYMLQYHFVQQYIYEFGERECAFLPYTFLRLNDILRALFKYVCMCTCTDNYFYWFHSKYSTAKSLNHSTIDEYSGYFCSIIKNTIKKRIYLTFNQTFYGGDSVHMFTGHWVLMFCEQPIHILC